jgi:hypothetical protein
MIRFILLSFVFMGWVFYEMSGGSSFNPEEMRQARLAAAAQAEAELQAKKQAEAEQNAAVLMVEKPKTVVDTTPPLKDGADLNNGQAPVLLNLTKLEDAPSTTDTDTDGSIAAGVMTNVVTITSSAQTPAIISSLISQPGGNDGQGQTDLAQSDQPQSELSGFEDIRTVSGNRVNVRGGPGTDFNVVTRLQRGDAVRILEDAGNGWVRLEPMDGGPAGWMADFLLVGG